MYICEEGDTETAERVIGLGADVNAKKEVWLECVISMSILCNGVFIACCASYRTQDGMTALMYACTTRWNTKTEELLLSKDADVNAKDKVRG